MFMFLLDGTGAAVGIYNPGNSENKLQWGTNPSIYWQGNRLRYTSRFPIIWLIGCLIEEMNDVGKEEEGLFILLSF